MRRIIITALNYLVLVALTVVVAVSLPLAAFAQRMIDGLTDEQAYVELVKGFGLGDTVRGFAVEATRFVVGLLPGDGGEALSRTAEVDAALGEAIDDAVAEVAAQIPAYVAGRRDDLAVDVSLTRVREALVKAGRDGLPGGRLLEGVIRSGVEKAVPEKVSLEAPLDTLEGFLHPVRVLVVELYGKIRLAHGAALTCLALIALLAFRLTRGARFGGAALVLAGIGGYVSVSGTDWLLGLVLPEVIVTNSFFQTLVARSLADFGTETLAWLVGGLALIAGSIAAPFAARGVARRAAGCRLAPVLALVSRRGERVSWSTVIALPVALVAFAASGSDAGPRRAARCALGGRLVAATALDYLLLPLGIAALSHALGEVLGLSFLGTLTSLPLWIVLLVYWTTRDWPRRRRGFNFTDALSGVVRGRVPGQGARVASLRRAVPLVVATLAAAVAPVPAAFGAVLAVELAALGFNWPDRTLGDLAAGTRARLLR